MKVSKALAKQFPKEETAVPSNRVSKEDKLRFKTEKFYRLQSLGEHFLDLKNGNGLAYLLKTNFLKLQDLLNNPSYQVYSIPKKKGGMRMIFAPEVNLLKIQQRLNQLLQVNYLTIRPAFVHGFVRYFPSEISKTNIVENAQIHVGKQTVLTIDLADFFPSISAKQIKNVFLSEPFYFDSQLATALTLLTTYEGKLPQGAPTSPVLSNFTCLKLDRELACWAAKNHINYSRYADDLTFSGEAFISTEKQQEIRQIILQNQFVVNEKKVRQRVTNRQQTVTGLTVNSKVNVDRRYLKKVRAMLHDTRINGISIGTKNHFNLTHNPSKYETQKFLNKLSGMIGFIGQVRGQSDFLYLNFRHQLDEIQAFN